MADMKMNNGEKNYRKNPEQNSCGRTGQQEVHRNIDVKNYVDEAEKVIKALIERKSRKNMISTSKLRNLLSMSSDIYNEILMEKGPSLSKTIEAKICYMRVRFYYEAGREESVKAFLNEADAFEQIKKIEGSRENFFFFHHYLESLVAFHRYYVGKNE